MFPWPHCHIFFDGSNTAPIVESRSILERCRSIRAARVSKRFRDSTSTRWFKAPAILRNSGKEWPS